MDWILYLLLALAAVGDILLAVVLAKVMRKNAGPEQKIDTADDFVRAVTPVLQSETDLLAEQLRAMQGESARTTSATLRDFSAVLAENQRQSAANSTARLEAIDRAGAARQRAANDALLALCSATLLCSGLLLIQQVPSLRPELLSYLFGDLLSIEWADLPIFAIVIISALVVLYRSWSAQIQIAIDPDIAMSEGVNANWQRLIFMLLLALFTVLALRAVGSLLMGALLVIPALSARLLAHSPKQMVIWAFILAQFGVTVGLWSSAALNIATGLSIVLCMALFFAVIFIGQKFSSRSL